MLRLKTLSLLMFMVLLATSCDKDKPGPQPDGSTKSKILVTNPWRLTDVTDPAGVKIPINQLGIQTLGLYTIDIQFFDNNVTKALDQKTSQVTNGGTWYLKENDKLLDIEISQFKGDFGVKELSRNKMSLTTQIPVNGVDKPGVLVFSPVVK